MPKKIPKFVTLERDQECADCAASLQKGELVRQTATRQGSLLYHCYKTHKNIESFKTMEEY